MNQPHRLAPDYTHADYLRHDTFPQLANISHTEITTPLSNGELLQPYNIITLSVSYSNSSAKEIKLIFLFGFLRRNIIAASSYGEAA